MENKQTHLKFIQDTIKRMSDHSFSVKGWAVALVAATFALAARADSRTAIHAVYFVIPVVWVLDGYYLSQEKRFRSLYDKVRQKTEQEIDFSMKPPSCPCETGGNVWVHAILSGWMC